MNRLWQHSRTSLVAGGGQCYVIGPGHCDKHVSCAGHLHGFGALRPRFDDVSVKGSEQARCGASFNQVELSLQRKLVDDTAECVLPRFRPRRPGKPTVKLSDLFFRQVPSRLSLWILYGADRRLVFVAGPAGHERYRRFRRCRHARPDCRTEKRRMQVPASAHRIRHRQAQDPRSAALFPPAVGRCTAERPALNTTDHES